MESIKLSRILSWLPLLILFACGFQNSDSSVLKESLLLNPIQFNNRISAEEDPQLIDVRTAEEFSQGSIKTARNYDLLNKDFERNLSNLDSTKTVYVFCAKGGRSGRAADLLEANGFHSIIDLKGGYTAWKVVHK